MKYSLSSAALVAASASLASARPAEIYGRSTFTVEQVAKGQKYLNGPLQMMHTYNKYSKIGASPPSDVVSAAAAAQSGEVEADPTQYDSSYLCPVSVAGQTLTLDFDTGSSDLWVFSTLQPSSEVNGQTQWDPSQGGATQLQGSTWSIGYGDGSGASGEVYQGTVTVGGVTATSQAIEAATSVSSEFASNKGTDGLLGLAFSSINQVKPQQQTTFFDTVSSSLAQALFTATLKAGEPGSYDFGYIDDSKYTGQITYVDVDNSQGFWQFQADGFSVGGSSNSSNAGSSLGTSIADTGTTLLYLPTDAVSAYYAQVSGASYDSSQGGYTFDCSTTLPDFVVSIGGASFTVPGSYINYAPATGSNCFGGIQANTGVGMNIFGDIFLKSVFAVFDQSQGSPRLGFAEQA